MIMPGETPCVYIVVARATRGLGRFNRSDRVPGAGDFHPTPPSSYLYSIGTRSSDDEISEKYPSREWRIVTEGG